MEILPREEWLKSLPRKIISACALFRNTKGEILIVKPTYHEGEWGLPGGIVETLESPRVGCMREVREEIGLDIAIERMLLVNDANIDEDMIDFIFDGGVLSEEEIAKIVLQDEELNAYRFASPTQAQELLRPKLKVQTRLALQALAENKTIYLDSTQG